MHNNPCPTMIDYVCTKPGEAFPFEGGPTLKEGETPPDKVQDGDFGAEIKPDGVPKYPEGTTFDEKGVPSQPPLPQPDVAARVLDPEKSEFFQKHFGDFDNPPNPNDRPLPDEYRPDIPYKPSTGERVFVHGTDGAIYSVPAETLSEAELKVYKEYPVYTSPQDEPYTGSPQISGNEDKSGSTFSGEQPKPDPNPCSWSLWGWCLWH